MFKRSTLHDLDRQIGIRLQYLRRMNGLTQAELAQKVALSRTQLTDIESCRTTLKLKVGWEICRILDTHPNWLLYESPGAGPFPVDAPMLDRVETLISGSAKSAFSTLVNYSWLLGPDGDTQWENEKKNLTSVNKNETVAAMTMKTLLARVRKATSAYGAKAALARDLGVSLANVSQWLSGDREPSGETTLKLLQWVEEQERK